MFVYVFGFYSNRVEGLCGIVVWKRNKNVVIMVINGYGFKVWRLVGFMCKLKKFRKL